MSSYLYLRALVAAAGIFLTSSAAAAQSTTPAATVLAGQAGELDQLESSIQRFILNEGLRVALLPKPSPAKRVSGYLKLRYGDEKSLLGKQVISQVTASTLMGGTRRHSREQLSERLIELDARLVLNTEEDYVGLRFDVSEAALPSLLEWMAEILREPSFPDEVVDTHRQLLIAQLAPQGNKAEVLADEALARHTNPFPRGDVRRQPELAETLAALATLKRDDLVRFHDDFYGADHGEFAIIGDFDVAQTRRSVERLFGGWHNRIVYQRAPRPFHAPTPAIVRIATPDNPLGQYRAMLRVPLRDDSREALCLTLAAHIFGGLPASSRLNERLRKDAGISNALAMVSFSGFEDSGHMRIVAVYPPAQRERLQAIVHEELQRMTEEGITAAELQRAKESLLQKSRQGRQSDSAMAAQLPAQLRLGRTMQFVAAREAMLNAVTVEDVNAATRRYLHAARLVEVFADADVKAVSALQD